MSLLPSIYANNFASVKAAKKSFVDDYVNNHPHRLSSIRLAVPYNTQFHGREVAGTALTAYKLNEDVDYATLSAWTRVFGELPVIDTIGQTGVAGGAEGLNEYEFYVAQDLYYFWRFYLVVSDFPEPVKVGELMTTFYERDSVESEWVETSIETEDIFENGYPAVITTSPFFNGLGGHPVSGGKGADNDENSAYLFFIFSGSGSPFSLASGIYRLPWQDPWADESSVYTDAMTDWIAENNDFDGGGWTGSAAVTLEFS